MKRCVTCRSSRRMATPIRKWFAENKPFPNPAALLIQPDHYIFRMLYSQGVSLESLGIPQGGTEGDANAPEPDPARGVAHLRQALLPLPGNADSSLAGLHARGGVRAEGSTLTGERG